MAVERRKDSNNRVLKEGEHQRGNGSYEYKWRDKRGKRHSIYAKSLKELRERKAEVLKDVLDGIQVDNSKMTVNDLYHRWIQIKRGLKDNTFQNYKYMYTQFVEEDLGVIKICDLKRSDVRSFYNFLADTQHLKANTIDTIHTVLHQVLELAVEDDYLRYNPSDNALKELKKAHNADSKKRKALTIEEQKLFVSFLEKPGQYNRWYPIFVVLLWTGMRVGEITGLRWCDINLEEGTISVNHTLVYYRKGGKTLCGYSINTPKTKAGTRIIPMMPIVKEAFLKEKEYQRECGIECKAVVDGYSDFIFINRFGGVQHQGTLNKALRRIIRDCNYEVLEKGHEKDIITLPKFSNHSLRHTFTTRMCEADVNIKAMQEILGHKDAETTLNIYTTATKELKREEMVNLKNHFEEYGRLRVV
jgi:integrase